MEKLLPVFHQGDAWIPLYAALLPERTMSHCMYAHRVLVCNSRDSESKAKHTTLTALTTTALF